MSRMPLEIYGVSQSRIDAVLDAMDAVRERDGVTVGDSLLMLTVLLVAFIDDAGDHGDELRSVLLASIQQGSSEPLERWMRQ